MAGPLRLPVLEFAVTGDAAAAVGEGLDGSAEDSAAEVMVVMVMTPGPGVAGSVADTAGKPIRSASAGGAAGMVGVCKLPAVPDEAGVYAKG
jgi:hypothetical protein